MSPEEVVHLAFVNAEGRPLNGANKQILHFEKGPPPANALWLVTMSDEDGS
jgi:hypothetical protein